MQGFRMGLGVFPVTILRFFWKILGWAKRWGFMEVGIGVIGGSITNFPSLLPFFGIS